MTGIHLCQPDNFKSCAACCGIYNYVDNTYSSLVERMAYRTRLFRMVRDGRMKLEQYQDAVRHKENSKRIFKTIYTCEFVGFLDQACRQVGCLLHPLQNNGEDLRTKSFYGRDICEGHFCPSYEKLTEAEAKIIISVIKDWYLYGIVITDIDFVKTFFNIVQDALGESISPDAVESESGLATIMGEYFSLKINWPFRDTRKPRFGKYFFVGEQYDIDRIDYKTLGLDTHKFDSIFLSLSSAFSTKVEVDRAGLLLDNIIERFCSEYRKIDRFHN